MIIWLALIVPFLFSLFLSIKYKHKVIWQELLIPIGACVLLIIIFKSIGTYSLVKDYEYWGGYVKEVRHYEDWNEYIHQTCEDCSTDSDGNTTCTTYDCSYVDYHPEEWHAYDNNGIYFSINKKLYNKLVKQFDNISFVDLERHYYTNDGDMYGSIWDGKYKSFEFCATKHTYENKVQASNSIFNYPNVDEEEISQYKLYNYPEITSWNKLPTIIGYKEYKQDEELSKKFDWLNGILGKDKQVKVWVLLYKDAPRQVGLLQEALWKGGNKNEFNIAISLDKNNNIQWCHVFSWTEVQILKVDTRTFVEGMEKLDLYKLVGFLYKNIDAKWKRKEFKDFDYLTVEPPFWCIIITFVVTFVVSFISSIWIVKNEFY